MSIPVIVQDWGLISYQEAWDKQEQLLAQKTAIKLNRNKPDFVAEEITNHLIFCEHPHVYTLGKNGHEQNLLLDEDGLKKANATFYKINRGGDITYHGPGQIVVYPIFDLEQFFTDIHKYLRYLEEAIIRTLSEFNIQAERYEGYTGVWLDADSEKARKICAMGVRCSRWVTMHGLAFNINTDLSYFKHIIPCGIDDKDVTSMQRELHQPQDIELIKSRLLFHLSDIFGFTPQSV